MDILMDIALYFGIGLVLVGAWAGAGRPYVARWKQSGFWSQGEVDAFQSAVFVFWWPVVALWALGKWFGSPNAASDKERKHN